MLRRLAVCALVLGLWGCSDEGEIAELTGYVKAIQKFNQYNQKIEAYIIQFDDPSIQKMESEVNAARQLVDDYAAALAALEEPRESSGLRNIHKLYGRSFNDARRLARDLTGDLNRQAHSVVIGLRNLRRDIRGRVYPSIEVLLARKGFSYEKGSEYALPWTD